MMSSPSWRLQGQPDSSGGRDRGEVGGPLALGYRGLRVQEAQTSSRRGPGTHICPRKAQDGEEEKAPSAQGRHQEAGELLPADAMVAKRLRKCFLTLMLLDGPGPGAPTSVPSVTEAKRVGISLRVCQEEVFLRWFLGFGQPVQSVQDGREWTRGVGVRGTTWQEGGGIQGTPGQDSGLLHTSPSTSGWSHRGLPASPSTERRGLPRAKTETLGQGPLVSHKDPPESLGCLVPSGLHSVEGAGVLVLREWAGACGGLRPHSSPWAAGRHRLGGGGGSAPLQKW